MSVPVRDLRNNSASLLKRVQQGESVVVTKDGEPVAEVIPLRRAPMRKAQLLQRWSALPQINAEQFRRDVDEMLHTANPDDFAQIEGLDLRPVRRSHTQTPTDQP